MEGWIKIHRKIVDWEWYKDNNTKIVFLHLLLTANHQQNQWQGITVERGQKLTSIRHLAKETNLTIQQVRNTLDKLKSTHEITIKPTHQYSLITIEKYDDYQYTGKENNTQNNTQENEQTTHNPTTNKNIKNDKNIYFILFNKYKRTQKGNFAEYMRAVREMKKDAQWDLLTEDEQTRIISEV